jgi:hypothetical protein
MAGRLRHFSVSAFQYFSVFPLAPGAVMLPRSGVGVPVTMPTPQRPPGKTAHEEQDEPGQEIGHEREEPFCVLDSH